jgi:phosphonopyruvate decarboxylase
LSSKPSTNASPSPQRRPRRCPTASSNWLRFGGKRDGHYGETGYQKSHTSLGVDLERIAAASGIKRSRTVANEADLAEGARLLREGNGTAFVVLRVKPDDPPAYKRNLDPAACRVRFRGALIGPG